MGIDVRVTTSTVAKAMADFMLLIPIISNWGRYKAVYCIQEYFYQDSPVLNIRFFVYGVSSCSAELTLKNATLKGR